MHNFNHSIINELRDKVDSLPQKEKLITKKDILNEMVSSIQTLHKKGYSPDEIVDFFKENGIYSNNGYIMSLIVMTVYCHPT
ncbi:hypothetical protein FBY58_0883 [Zymomonas mobilis]|uniref:Uncharacterized protein n=1 Tax=Zymomonas mobilis TaxID=542 RepID=A0A542W161_ZYMMB|nr:hypothetical protein FBY58_0883 [Zymomonas mobilis]